MNRAVGTAALASLVLGAAATKDPSTLVILSFGDWGWSSVGANNSILQTAAAAACANQFLTNPSTVSPSCNNNQGYLYDVGLQKYSQLGVASAMAASCIAYGGCDFALNTGDNFYDLGITGGVKDPQWLDAYVNVFNITGLAATPMPILTTLGNHNYSILANNAAASEIAYTAVDPLKSWTAPAHNFQKTFASANKATRVQIVVADSTPLHNRYLYSGASGGKYAKDNKGVSDTLINAPASAIVINPGVTPANGFTNGNYFNASRYAGCYYNFSQSLSGVFNVPVTVGAASFPGTLATTSSGCKYASPELAPLASPAARAATYNQVGSWFQAGYTQNQYQIMLSHFPLLSTQQRFTPYYDSLTSTFASLGAAAPQAYFNGHDHIQAVVTSPSITTAGGNPIQFITTGSAGSVDYGTGTVPTGPGAVPPGGYAVGAAAVAAATSAAFDSSDGPYVAQPPSGTAQSNPAYNPDVNGTNYWSPLTGYTISTLNTTFMRVDFFLVNCTQVYLGVPCTNQPGQLVNTLFIPAKPVAPVPQHVFDLTSSPVADTGSVGGWTFVIPAANAPAASGYTFATNASVAGKALTVGVVATIAPGTAPGWYVLWAVDGVSLSIYNGPIAAAPGVNVSSLAVLSNTNGASSNCNKAFFLDGSASTLNGKPAPGAAAASAAFPPGVPTSILFTVSASGVPGVPTDANGNAFVPIAFPAGSGSSVCAPLALPAGTLVTANTGSSTMAALPGGVTYLSVSLN